MYMQSYLYPVDLLAVYGPLRMTFRLLQAGNQLRDACLWSDNVIVPAENAPIDFRR